MQHDLISEIRLMDLTPMSGGNVPTPYIGVPPSSPGGLGTVSQVRVVHAPKEQENLWEKPYCKHCGSFLSKGQSVCPSCGNKVI